MILCDSRQSLESESYHSRNNAVVSWTSSGSRLTCRCTRVSPREETRSGRNPCQLNSEARRVRRVDSESVNAMSCITVVLPYPLSPRSDDSALRIEFDV